MIFLILPPVYYTSFSFPNITSTSSYHTIFESDIQFEIREYMMNDY
jgi:hypothetical protein